LDEGKIFFNESEKQIQQAGPSNPHIQQIIEAATEGNWVLLCPVMFPHFFSKLLEKLGHMSSQGQINPNFRLLVDL